MEFLIENWQWLLLVFYIAEKVVKVTPVKWDDILIDGLKEGLNKIIVGKFDGKPRSRLP